MVLGDFFFFVLLLFIVFVVRLVCKGAAEVQCKLKYILVMRAIIFKNSSMKITGTEKAKTAIHSSKLSGATPKRVEKNGM